MEIITIVIIQRLKSKIYLNFKVVTSHFFVVFNLLFTSSTTDNRFSIKNAQ